MSYHIDPEIQEWAKQFVQYIEDNIEAVIEEYHSESSMLIYIPIWSHITYHKSLLEYTTAKLIQKYAEGVPIVDAFSDKNENDAYQSLPYRDELLEKCYKEWKKRHGYKIAPALEKYVILRLQGNSHDQIREQLTQDENMVLNRAKQVDIRRVWESIRVKPEIQRLLVDKGFISNAYKSMTTDELQKEADRASTEIYSATRTGGLMIFAPSGWGKSRLLGRSICYEYAKNKIGTVVLDVVGGTVDNALDKIARHKPISERQEIGSRIRYCNMAGERIGTDVFVTVWPMLVRRDPYESLHTITQRIVDLIATTDRNLASASIQGFNRLAPLLTSVTTILAALDLPLVLAYQILSDPETWKSKIEWVGQNVSEAQEAAAEILTFYKLDKRRQEERSEVLRNKLSFLKFDQISRAMFSAKEPLINWGEVAEKGLQVYIDLRNETSQQAMQVKLFWVWNSLMEFIRSRGSSGRQKPPLAVVVDELSYFVRGSSLNTEAISEEFRDFVQVRRRNANILLVASTQERSELPLTMQSACLQLPSHLYGATSDPETAIDNAKRWYKKDPKKLKIGPPLSLIQENKVIDIYASYRPGKPDKTIIDRDPVYLEFGSLRSEYMSLEEQDYENSLNFLNLSKAEWLFAKSPAEGVPPTELAHITTATLDPNKYVREQVVAKFRQVLMQRDGIPTSAVLHDIENQSLSTKSPADAQPAQGTPYEQPTQPPPSNEQTSRRTGKLPLD